MRDFSKYIVAVAVLAAILIRGYLFYASSQFLPVTTDEAAAMLLAKDIAKGNYPLLFSGQPYQFPIEAYILSLFSSILPMTAFGARVVFAVIASMSVVGFYLIYRSIAKREDYLPGLVLVLVSSAYVLTLQSAYFIPQYTLTLTFSWLILLLSAKVLSTEGDSSILLIFVAGVLAGLSLSNHLLILPIVVMAGLAICIGRNFKNAFRNTILFLPGLLLGLIPYLLAASKTSDFAGSITGRHSLSVAISRLFSTLVNNNLQTVLGYNISFFPDFGSWKGLFPVLITPGMYFFWIVICSVTFVRAYKFFLRVLKDKWPSLGINDVFLGASWMCIFAFLLSTRGKQTEYRYFLPVAWCFPYLLSYLYAIAHRYVRVFISIIVCVLFVVNISQTIRLVEGWKDSEFIAKVSDMPDITPVVDYLDTQGISSCYASFWFSYRFPFETNERLTCSQPFNERFQNWPLPYKSFVDNSDKAAYVLTNSHQARLTGVEFLKRLIHQRIEVKTKVLEPFIVFHDFKYKGVKDSLPLAVDEFSVITSHNDTQAKNLVDGDTKTSWQSALPQEKGMSVRFELKSARLLNRVRINFGEESLKRMPVIKVSGSLDGDKWFPLRHTMKPRYNSFLMDGPHPVFSNKSVQEISLPASKLIYLKLQIDKPKTKYEWVIPEITIFGESL